MARFDGYALQILQIALSLPVWTLAVSAFSAIFFWPVGAQLSVFVNPNMRFRSPLIRSIGWVISFFGRLTLIVFVTAFVVLAYLLWWANQSYFDYWKNFTQLGIALGVGSSLGGLLAGIVCFRLIPEWSSGDGLRDIRTEVKKMTGAPLYDPLKYINLDRGVFIGLTQKRKPLYISWQHFRSTHFQIPGASGYGKGITLGLLAYQSILAGEMAIMFDPKLDDFLLAVYARAALEKGLPLHVVNLRQEQIAQFNPIAGATGPELEEMLVGSMELFDSGSDADFHRGNDRDAAEALARMAVENEVWSLPELLVLASNNKAITEREGFWRKFRHLSGLSAVQTDADIDLTGIVERGEPLYIIGTTVRDPKVTMLQKLVLVRLIQLIEKRPKAKSRPVMLTLDEVRHQISNVSLTALGTLRSANCHVAIAHQSYGDLFENQALSPDAVRGAVIDNTTLKIVYHLKDAELAKTLSAATAEIRTFTESVGQINPENPVNERTWREANIPVVEPGIFTHLPSPIGSDNKLRSATGIAFSDKIATMISISPVMSDVQPPTPKHRPPSWAQASHVGIASPKSSVHTLEDLI